MAVIRVGAAHETEMKYLKDKIEDAVNATKAAIAEGIVPGGGAALAKVSAKLLSKIENMKADDEYQVGYRILALALQAPLLQIVKNTGREDGAVILKETMKGGATGFNAATEEMVDMFEAGIIDPVKVTRSGVQNAASAAAVLLTTEAAIADIPEDKKAPVAGMGGMDGMD